MSNLPFKLAVLVSVLSWLAPSAIASRIPKDNAPAYFHVHGPYFKLNEGFYSRILLRNSHLKIPVSVVPVLHSVEGRTLRLAAISLAPNEARMVDIETALRDTGERMHSGAVSLEFDGAGPATVNGLLIVKNEKKSLIFTFPMRAGYAHGESRSLEAPWWFLDDGDEGTLALFNSSNADVVVRPSATVRQEVVALREVALAPRAAVKIDLRRLLKEAGIRGVTEGALSLKYEGPAHALIPGLFFANEKKGYSVNSVFVARQQPQPDQKTVRLGPSVLINSPYASMGFPAYVKLTPHMLLSNTTADSKAVEIKATFEPHGGEPTTVTLPISPLSVLETRRIDFSEFVASGLIPETVGQINLRVTFDGSASSVLTRLFSMDGGGDYVFSTELTQAHAKSDSAYWNVAGNEYSAVMIQNVTEDPIEVRVTLHYNGGPGIYKVPLLSIPGRATRKVDIRKIVRSGTADDAGNIVPADVTFGSARVQRSDGRSIPSFALLGAMYDPAAGMCGEVFIPCVGVFSTAMFNDPTTGIVGSSAPVSVSAYWDNGDTTDETWQGSFFSHDPGIATFDNNGNVQFISPGSTIGQANLALYEALKPGALECVLIYFVAAAFLNSEPAPEVTTDDVVVVAWVNGSVIGLPGGATQSLVDRLNTPLLCSALLAEWVDQIPDELGTDANRAYANAFLLRYSYNNEPPLGIPNPSAFLTAGDFRLFTRLKVKFNRVNNKITNPTFLQSSATVGKTPDPCGILPALAGENHPSNGSQGLTSSQTGVYKLVEGRIGAAGQLASLTINKRTTPFIWSVIKFDAFGSLTVSDRAIFPTYYVYRNGELVLIFPQSAVSTFIALDDLYMRVPGQIQ